MTKRRGRGEGSVCQRHDHETCPPLIDGPPDAKGRPTKVRPSHTCRGRWTSTIDYGWENGKRRRKVIYGQTKADVLTKMKDAQRRAPASRSDSRTVAAWLNEWLQEIARPKIKDSTYTSHKSKIDQYLIPLIGKHRLDRLEPRHIRRMYSRMTEACPAPVDKDGEKKCPHSPSHGLSAATARQTHAILSRALKDAKREGLVAENEAENLDAPSTKKRQRDQLTGAQADLVLTLSADDPYISRWYAALRMGLRQGEALGLPWGMVDLEAGTVTIVRTLQPNGKWGTPKSEASNRTIAIEPTTLAHLKVHRARWIAKHDGPPPPDALVWAQDNGRPIGHKTDWQRWKALLEKTGVPHVALHSARQTAARRLEEIGWHERLAAEYLGHSDVRTTYGYQRGAGVERQAEAFGAIEA